MVRQKSTSQKKNVFIRHFPKIKKIKLQDFLFVLNDLHSVTKTNCIVGTLPIKINK